MLDSIDFDSRSLVVRVVSFDKVFGLPYRIERNEWIFSKFKTP